MEMGLQGCPIADAVDEETRHAAQIQEELLGSILQKNLHTEYLQKCGIMSPTKQAFKELVPIITYKAIKPDILRIANGDKSHILMSDPVAEFLISSGTLDGIHKLFPKPEGYLKEINRLTMMARSVFDKYFPGLKEGKTLNFIYVRESGSTPSGLVSQTSTTSYYRSPYSGNNASNMFTSPREVILCTDSVQTTYCHLLCGLINSQEVMIVGSFFASTLVRVIRSLEDCWQDICEDLHTGRLNSKITNPSVIAAMEKVLQPNPELASRVRAECCNTSWKGIIRRLWPRTMLIETVVTGSMQQYISAVDYYSDGLQIVSLFYGSSETFVGMNINPLCSPWEVTYLLPPSAAYFEFLPVSRNSETADQLNSHEQTVDFQSVDLVDVEVGKEYEVVVTTDSGLYRYRMGDILKCSGFYNAAPTFFFVCRQNVLLSIDSDKTDEKDLLDAITSVTANLHTTVRDFSSYVHLASKPPHYVLFWELGESKEMERDELQECCYGMEERLNSAYRRGRRENAIGPMEIRLVRKGSFEKLMECIEAKGGNLGQLKIPRCLKHPSDLLEVLETGVYECAFSPRLPPYSSTILAVAS